MAYTNATFYMDLVSGSDTARAGKTPTAYANNGSGVVRVTIATHGYVTGTIVDITGTTSSVYVGAWKITVIDANNFDLDTSTFTVNPATKGTVTSRGGSSWTDAWLTPTSGATAARVAAGDTIRIAKTSDPVSMGNGTWTNKSMTVTLASALTTTIDNCETAWTAANSATVTRNSTNDQYKQGSYSAQIVTPAATAINTKYAYRNLGTTLNLSSYNAITFWIYVDGFSIGANNIVIKLCSDTTGDTAVDTITLPANIATNQRWTPITVTRDGGGNLGSNIQSLSFYTGSSSIGNSRIFRLDNFSACSSTGFNLNTLIGRSSNGYSLTDPWFTINGIDGTTITLGADTGSSPRTIHGWYTTGTSPSTATTYYMTPLITSTTRTEQSGGGQYTLNTSGTVSSPVVWSGGWNKTTNNQDGVTWFDNRNSVGGILFYFTAARDYNSFYRLGLSRYAFFTNPSIGGNPVVKWSVLEIICSGLNRWSGYATGILASEFYGYSVGCFNGFGSQINGYGHDLLSVNSQQNGMVTGYGYNKNIVSVNHLNGAYSYSSSLGELFIDTVTIDNCASTGFTASTRVIAQNMTITNCSPYALGSSGTNAVIKVYNLTTSGSSSGSIINNQASVYLFDPSIAESTIVTNASTISNSTYITNLNSSTTDNRIYSQYGNVLSQTTTRHTASGVAWQTNVTNTILDINYQYRLSLAKIAVSGNKLVTVKAWVKLSHATDIGAKLVAISGQLSGMTNDAVATKSADTNWEELTITFTPTMAGVVEIQLWSYWLANLADESTYVDDMTITEAA